MNKEYYEKKYEELGLSPLAQNASRANTQRTKIKKFTLLKRTNLSYSGNSCYKTK